MVNHYANFREQWRRPPYPGDLGCSIQFPGETSTRLMKPCDLSPSAMKYHVAIKIRRWSITDSPNSWIRTKLLPAICATQSKTKSLRKTNAVEAWPLLLGATGKVTGP